jgi:putative intracellular protease/amidase
MTRYIVLPAAAGTWTRATRRANILARAGHAPRWAETDFTGLTDDGVERAFGAGSFAVPVDPARPLGHLPEGAVAATGLTGFDGPQVRPIRIAAYGNGGAPYNHAAAFAAMGFLTEFVFAEDIMAGCLADFDMLVMPGGGSRAMFGQLDPLGEAGCRKIADFVRGGGMYLGSCAGAFDASLVSEGFVAACPQQVHLRMINAAVWNDGDAWMGLQSPGVGVIRSAVAATHPVTRGVQGEIDMTHYNGPLYALRQGAVDGAMDAVGLMRVVGAGDAFTPAEQFLGAATPLDDCLVTDAAAAQAFNAVAGAYGAGLVVLFGSHPEFGLSLDLGDWGDPARLMANAGLWQASMAGPARAERIPCHIGDLVTGPPLASASSVCSAAARVAEAAAVLQRRDATVAGWLDSTLAMSSFGATGREIWDRNLAAVPGLVARIAAELDGIADLLRDNADTVDPGVAAARAGVEQAMSFAPPADWNNDFGYEGVLPQLERARSMLTAADTGFGLTFAPDDNAYAYLNESPFHLAVGSYLSAVGVLSNSLLLLQMQKDRLKTATRVAALVSGPATAEV